MQFSRDFQYHKTKDFKREASSLLLASLFFSFPAVIGFYGETAKKAACSSRESLHVSSVFEGGARKFFSRYGVGLQYILMAAPIFFVLKLMEKFLIACLGNIGSFAGSFIEITAYAAFISLVVFREALRPEGESIFNMSSVMQCLTSSEFKEIFLSCLLYRLWILFVFAVPCLTLFLGTPFCFAELGTAAGIICLLVGIVLLCMAISYSYQTAIDFACAVGFHCQEKGMISETAVLTADFADRFNQYSEAFHREESSAQEGPNFLDDSVKF